MSLDTNNKSNTTTQVPFEPSLFVCIFYNNLCPFLLDRIIHSVNKLEHRRQIEKYLIRSTNWNLSRWMGEKLSFFQLWRDVDVKWMWHYFNAILLFSGCQPSLLYFVIYSNFFPSLKQWIQYWSWILEEGSFLDRNRRNLRNSWKSFLLEEKCIFTDKYSFC